ncbi:integrase core domain-containing protein [Candidatus Margulisiibacteriota bacterium]
MSWMEVDKVEQRKRFILRLLNGERMTDLCREYDISRKTGYKFLERFKEFGFDRLSDLSRTPHRIHNKTNEILEEHILYIKAKYPTWGPKKIKAKAEEMHQGLKFPAASTIGAILDKHGLVKKSKRRIKRSYHSGCLSESKKANDIWCIDYKGQFLTQDRHYCYPLTISDHQTRFLIACEALESTRYEDAYYVFKHCFKKHGLPKSIRSDNGTPFASVNAIFGLTKLSAWFLKLGIKVERIAPGHPEQNGRHERMHRTLKQDVLRPPARNIIQQQEAFDTFRRIYNHERPHEALGQVVPFSVYENSAKPFNENVVLDYATHDIVRKVDFKGDIKLANKRTVISTVLSGEYVGLRELDDTWLVSYADYDIGHIDKESLKFTSLEYLD